MDFANLDLRTLVEPAQKAALFCRYYLPAEQLPHLSGIAAGAAVSGAVLSLWGARLLRLLYALAFTAAGAAAGVHLARAAELDALIGLVLGAGLAGVAGHLFYRWWVGATAGLCAMMLVAVVGGGQLLPEFAAEMQAYQDRQLGVASGGYDLAAAPQAPAPGLAGAYEHARGLSRHLWETRRELVLRAAFVLGLAWVVGLSVGVLLPRFTTVVGTAVLGVAGLAGGVGCLLSLHSPGLWRVVTEQAPWLLGGLSVFLLGALCYQLRQGRIGPSAALAPAAA